MVTDSSGWAATHVGALTCHGTELHRSSNPDMTISAKHNQDAACTVKTRVSNLPSVIFNPPVARAVMWSTCLAVVTSRCGR